MLIERTQRRLAAIFCADVEGYARLMNADEAATLRLLTSHREVTDRLIDQHGGRIANTAGDSILAEFPSVVDALNCALDILARVAAVNQEVASERRVCFRIGIHVGEVAVRGGDLYGDGVNIAARMQELAPPGSVCLSEMAHQFVHKAMALTYEDIGPQRVKNLETAIRAYVVHASGEPVSRALPPIHRRSVAHLARRFHDLCHRALMDVTSPQTLTPQEFAALMSLSDSPAIDQLRLAERIAVHVIEAQRLLNGLEDRKLACQSPDPEKRSACIWGLTRDGVEMIQSLRPLIVAAQDRIMAALSDRERATLEELLARVIRANEAKRGTDDNRQA